MRRVCLEWRRAVDAAMLLLQLPSSSMKSKRAPLCLHFAGVQHLALGRSFKDSSCNNLIWTSVVEVSKLQALRSLSLNMPGCGARRNNVCYLWWLHAPNKPVAGGHASRAE